MDHQESRGFLIGQIRKARPAVAILIALVLLAVADRRLRAIENIPDLVLRSEYRSQAALPYMLARMRKDDPSVVFLGASVMQGVTNTMPEDAFPMVIRSKLRAKGREVYCFNTATMGHNIGDQYCLAAAAITNGADALVLAAHYKLLSSHPIVGNPLRFKQFAYFLRTEKGHRKLIARTFEISRFQWWGILLRGKLSNIWGLYRYRELVPYLLTGSMDDPLLQFQDAYARQWNLTFEGEIGRNVLRGFDLQERERDDLWKQMIDTHHERDREIYNDLNVNRHNPHFKMMSRIAHAAQRANVPLLIYFSPLNRALNEEKNYFQYNNVEHLKELVRVLTEETGATLIDANDAVPPQYFSDMDHFNRKGHLIMADRLAPAVEAMLDRRKK
ncbi:MAG: SGNH/GDSL hydrolase family protein [Deltaproteobacteria bacterium]|nr:SGNH/GDSL hydrolase family protein [Deltaproteobacteria bacterium]